DRRRIDAKRLERARPGLEQALVADRLRGVARLGRELGAGGDELIPALDRVRVVGVALPAAELDQLVAVVARLDPRVAPLGAEPIAARIDLLALRWIVAEAAVLVRVELGLGVAARDVELDGQRRLGGHAAAGSEQDEGDFHPAKLSRGDRVP